VDACDLSVGFVEESRPRRRRHPVRRDVSDERFDNSEPGEARELRPEDQPTMEHKVTGEVGIDWRATAVGNASPPIRIVGRAPRWQGQFRVDR
jgi:hypothetical protein